PLRWDEDERAAVVRQRLMGRRKKLEPVRVDEVDRREGEDDGPGTARARRLDDGSSPWRRGHVQVTGEHDPRRVGIATNIGGAVADIVSNGRRPVTPTPFPPY